MPYKDREKQIQNAMDWSKRNPTKRKEIDDRYRKNEKIRALEYYSNGIPTCSCCGETRIEFLSLDHSNNGRGNPKQDKLSGYHFYTKLKLQGYPQGFRVLCHNCNQSFGYYSYCPHQKEGESEV